MILISNILGAQECGLVYEAVGPNACNTQSKVEIGAPGATPPGADGTAGWLYDPANGHFYANLPDAEVDAAGDPYNEY